MILRSSRQVVDPWAGSYFMENLTNELYDSAMKIIEEVCKGRASLSASLSMCVFARARACVYVYFADHGDP